MAVDISQNGLQWVSSIDNTEFNRQYDEIQRKLNLLASTSAAATKDLAANMQKAMAKGGKDLQIKPVIDTSNFDKGLQGIDKKIDEISRKPIIDKAAFDKSIAGIQQQLDKIGRKPAIDLSAMDRSIRDTQLRLQGLSQTSKQTSIDLQNLGQKAAGAIGAYLSLTAGKQFVNDVIRVRGEFQQLEIAFRTMLKSKEAGDALFREAVTLAAQTPLELKDVAGATKQLLAYGASASTVVDEVRMLGDVASGTGQPLQEITYLYGTLRSQGRAYAMDIRQFAGRGIPIIGELAKQFGVSAEEVNKLVEAGKVGFPEIEKAFRTLTSEGGIFNDMLNEQAKSITGQIAKLSDAWDLMLNDIGTSQEGFITDVISTLSAGVENYQTILDVIKSLVVVYGAYKAAVITTVAIQAVQNNMVKGYTILEQLRLRAMILSEAAMRVLNKTMLLNPAVAVVTGIAAITAAFLLLRKQTDGVVTALELTGEAARKANESFGEKKSEIRAYVESLKNVNTSESERLRIYNKLKEIGPAIVEGLDAKSISYEKLSGNVNLYLNSLREQLKLEANTDAVKKSIQAESAIESQIEAQQRLAEAAEKAQKAAAAGQKVDLARGFGRNGAFSAAEARIESRKEIEKQTSALERQQKVTKELGDTTAKLSKNNKTDEAVKLRTLQVIDAEIKALKDSQEAKSTSSKEYLAFEKQIAALEKERGAIAGESRKTIKDRSSAETELNAVLQKRTGILQSIAAFERDAKQSGLLKQASEIDKINERYEEQVRLLNEVNAEIDKYNKKNPKNQKSLLGAEELNRLRAARDILIENQRFEDEAEKYIELSKLKSRAFEDYRQVEEKGNAEMTAAAFAAYKDQMDGFDSYLAYLKAEAAKILPKLFSGTMNKGDALKLQGLSKQFNEETQKTEADAKARKLNDFNELLQASRNYNSERLALDTKYYKNLETLDKARSSGEIDEQRYQEKKAALDKNNKAAIDSLNIQYAEESKQFKKLTDYILVVDRKVIKQRIKNLEDYMAVVAEFVGTETDYYKRLEQELGGLKISLSDKDLESFQMFSDLAGQLGDSFAEAGGALGEIGGLISALTSQTQRLTSIMKEGASESEVIADGIGAAVDLVMLVINASAERKRAEEAYYASVIAQQEDYNLLLNKQISIQQKMNENVFVANYESRIAASFDQLRDATQKYSEALDKLSEGQAKLGQRNAANAGAIGAGIASGATLGLAIGTIVPGIGNLIGTVVGGIVGGIVGLIGGMKKKDVFGSLLEEYPELIKQAANGMEELNVELAKTLVSSNLVDEATKKMLESAIAWTEQIEEARESMKNIISELAGDLGNSLRNSLVNAFKDGTNAAQAFSDNVSKVLEDMLSQLIFSKVFTGAFDQLEEDMLKSFDFGGDSSWVDDFGRFFEQADDLTEEFNKNLEAAQQEAAKFNIDIFKRNQQTANSGTGISGTIKGITEQQADLLAGQFGGLRMTAIEQLRIATSSLTVLNDIRYNTSFIELSYRILGEFKLNGIKIKP